MFKIICGNDYDSIQAELTRATTMPCTHVLSVASIIDRLYQKTLVEQPTAFVVRYDDNFMKANESDWQKVKDACTDSTLILLYGVLDKRGKFYKFFKENITECNQKETGSVAFEFVDEFVTRNKRAFKSATLIQDSDVISVLTMLYNRVRCILQIQSTPKNINIVDNTGLTQQNIYWNKKFVGYYTEAELINCLRWIDYIVGLIKKSTLISSDALHYLLIHIII